MTEFFTHVLIVLVPLLLTGMLHMVAVKGDWLKPFQIPIWRKGFGENKTWRGVIFVPTVNALFLLAISYIFRLQLAYPFLLGYVLGLSYLLFELPNSFLKRKAGIKAGGHHDKHKYLFYVLDKTDSSFGVTLSYMLITGMTLKMAGALLLINSMTHTVVALVLVRLKIKSSF